MAKNLKQYGYALCVTTMELFSYAKIPNREGSEVIGL
jgi:hypothetical protein